MKCLNCGHSTAEYLCPGCRTEAILDKITPHLLSYNAERCDFPYLTEYAATLSDPCDVRNCIHHILPLLPDSLAEYYHCQYVRFHEKDKIESTIEKYLTSHEWSHIKSQKLIGCLLDYYIPNDFIKPRFWCDWIAETDDLCAELYAKAAKYFGMIGEYDLSDKMIDLGFRSSRFLYFNKEQTLSRLEKQREDTLRYRTKKPYWPTTEERRRAVAMFYAEKGISYPRIEGKPTKVPENEFAPIKECFDAPESYCAFWCSEAFAVQTAKPIYQIAAIKVENSNIVDQFQSFIRPQDGGINGRKSAAKEVGVPVSVIEEAPDVDQVMVKFFQFVGNTVLVSSDALGSQAKLLCRAARYTGMKFLPNELYDLLDLAMDCGKFSINNCNRAYLLNYFGIPEGKDALEKAKANIALYAALKHLGASPWN